MEARSSREVDKRNLFDAVRSSYYVWCSANVERDIYQIQRRKGKQYQPQGPQSPRLMEMQEAQLLEPPALISDYSWHQKYLRGEGVYFEALGRLPWPHVRREGGSKIF